MNLGPRFFEGSADAVLQNLDVIENERPAHVCVFGADHIYKMDVRQMLRFHIEREADATVAVIPVPAAEASGFGIAECDAEKRVTAFLEKPPVAPDARGTRLASMGLYSFRAGVLLRAITADANRANSTHDFGRDILPGLVDSGRLLAYDFTTNDIPGMSSTSAATGVTSAPSTPPGTPRRISSPCNRDSAFTTRSGRSTPRTTRRRRRSSCSRTASRTASASRPTRWCPRAASSAAVV
jgi:hypothetical protein